jgi:CRISPR/Cas system-associated protein endoribonuclease Cas2
MKKTVVKRSSEELEKFFRKSSNRAVINNLSEQKPEKKSVSLHQLIEKAVSKLDIPVTKNSSLVNTEIQEDDIDDIPFDFEEEE